MIAGIAHAAYAVPDMAAALDFYVGKLGFTHAFSLKNDKGEPWIEYLMVSPGQFVELFHAGEGFANPKGSYRHLCLTCTDLPADVAALKSRGAVIRSGPSQGKDSNWQAWVDDPAGNPIELMQINPDSPQAKASRA